MIKLNFDVKKHKLENGLEVLTIKKDTQISSINVGIKVGSLNESKDEKGISHFIEHMMFKGTIKRGFEKLNDDLESLGGEYNAYTDYSITVYSISCLEEELGNAIELLGDMVTNSVFLQEEIEKERGVILAEMKASMDSVEDLSFKRVNEIAFVKSCVRYDVAGTEKNVKKFTRKDLISYYEKHYIPNNTLITMVSSLEHEEALEKIKENFGHWQSKELVAVEIFDEQNKAIRKTTYKKNIELSTIMYLFTF